MATSRKNNPRVIPDGKASESFNVIIELRDKAKTIAAAEGISKSDLYNIAVEKYIDLYEKKNGKVKTRTKGQGLV